MDSTKVTTNLGGERWSKLVANSMGNGLQAITGLSSREMAMTAEVRRLTIRLAAEAVEVGQAIGPHAGLHRWKGPGSLAGSGAG